MITNVWIKFDWFDRLRIFWHGRAEVYVRTFNVAPAPGRSWEEAFAWIFPWVYARLAEKGLLLDPDR